VDKAGRNRDRYEYRLAWAWPLVLTAISKNFRSNKQRAIALRSITTPRAVRLLTPPRRAHKQPRAKCRYASHLSTGFAPKPGAYASGLHSKLTHPRHGQCDAGHRDALCNFDSFAMFNREPSRLRGA
jgi:hypothetical protein